MSSVVSSEEVSNASSVASSEASNVAKEAKYLSDMSSDAIAVEQKIAEMAVFFASYNKCGNCTELWMKLLAFVGLEGFADSSNPTKIPSKGDICGLPDRKWNLYLLYRMRFSDRRCEWDCSYIDDNGAVKNKPINLLKNALEETDHFRVDALIKMLNIFKGR
jgi:hypothetical protein